MVRMAQFIAKKPTIAKSPSLALTRNRLLMPQVSRNFSRVCKRAINRQRAIGKNREAARTRSQSEVIETDLAHSISPIRSTLP